jgi:hypothetical protein
VTAIALLRQVGLLGGDETVPTELLQMERQILTDPRGEPNGEVRPAFTLT